MNAKTEPSSIFVKNFVRFTYKPIVILTLVFMVVITIMAAWIIYYSMSELKEPEWFLSFHLILSLFNSVLNPENTDAFRALSSLSVALAALFMGYFLKKCASSKHKFEIITVFLLLIIGVIQLVIIIIMPSFEMADFYMINGRELVIFMNDLLTKTSNIAIAVFSASMGIQISNSMENKHE